MENCKKRQCSISDLTVLVVDGDEQNLEEMCDILRFLGIVHILCSPDAESALCWLDHEKDIDIIITSNVLPNMDGFLFVHHARVLFPSKPIIMYSNSKKPTSHLTALNIGATDYIDKNENFKKNVINKLPFWIGVTQQQIKLEGSCCGR